MENGDYGGEQKAETLKSQPKELGDITWKFGNKQTNKKRIQDKDVNKRRQVLEIIHTDYGYNSGKSPGREERTDKDHPGEQGRCER